MSKIHKMQIKFDRGVKINRDLFLFITGLDDERNNKQKLREEMDKAFDKDGFISSICAEMLTNRLWRTGQFWMFTDVPSDNSHETGLYRRIMEFVDTCDIKGVHDVHWL